MAEREKYTIRFPVDVHGWDEHVEVEVEADNQWQACRLLGSALTKLVKRRGRKGDGPTE